MLRDLATLIVVDALLISDTVPDAPLSCHLRQFQGGCRLHGDRGAPVEPDERESAGLLVSINNHLAFEIG